MFEMEMRSLIIEIQSVFHCIQSPGTFLLLGTECDVTQLKDKAGDLYFSYCQQIPSAEPNQQ